MKSITIKDIKNYIEFANGKVLVKPFTIKVKDIEMQIGGMHGFDQSIDYVIGMKVPRKYMGKQGNKLVNDLVTQANIKGMPVKLGEMVDLNVKMTGSLSNPAIHIDLKQVAGDAIKELKQQAVDFAKEKAESMKQAVKDSVNAVKNQVAADLKDEIKDKIFGSKDSTQKTGNLDSTKKKAGETIKNTLVIFLKRKKNRLLIQPNNNSG